MLPGLEPLSFLNIILTVGGFVGGALFWQIIGTHSGLWKRMEWDPDSGRRLLTQQLSFVVVVTALMMLLGVLLGASPLGGLFRWLSTIGGIIFFAYLGALLITAWHGIQIHRSK